MEEKLKNIEEIYNLNPREMADLAGVTPQHYYAVRDEEKKTKLSKQTTFLLFLKLGIALDYKGQGELLKEAAKVVNEFIEEEVA